MVTEEHVPVRLVIPFRARGRSGTVTATLAVNDRPATLGCPDRAAGFPHCTATIDFEGLGYDAIFGWVQLVGTSQDSRSTLRFTLDPLEIYDGLETPFGFHGYKPSLFDAPSRSDLTTELFWLAHSFLCIAPSGPMRREIVPVAAFSWGFAIESGRVTTAPLKALDIGTWNDHRSTITDRFPTWEFLPVDG